MSYIFHKFKTERDAEAFVGAAKTIGLPGQVFTTSLAAFDHDPFPYELSPPIVHIDRTEDDEYESLLIETVKSYGGRYAGT